MKQKRILIPTDGPETWKRFLANPKKHWKSGFSAMSTAYSWECAEQLPAEIEALFKNAHDAALHDASLALAIPEYKVDLAGGTRPSQNDVFALLTCTGGLFSMMVEGKAKEDFDDILGDWKQRTSKHGVKMRMSGIMDNIGLSTPVPDEIRYQLLHRAASAVIEAKRFHAPYAAVVVQSFVADDRENHYDDFCKFVSLFHKTPMKDLLIEISRPHGRRLFAAWVQSKPSRMWAVGKVDRDQEHIELRYGDASKSSYEEWHPLAIVGKQKKGIFPVVWLAREENPEEEHMVEEARKELDFYLIEHGAPDPWEYAKYHCSTGANMYSSVHWSYFPTGYAGKRHASRVVHLSADKEIQR